MYDLCVKLKQRENVKYRRIESREKNIYANIDNLDGISIPYSPQTILDSDSWFCIELFSENSFKIDLITETFSSVDFYDLKKSELSKVDFLFVLSDNMLFFQNVSKVMLISKKKSIIYFGNRFQFQEDDSKIVINEKPDAIYDRSKDKLYFRSLSSITSIFKGIDQLYREATEEETTSFLNSDFITLCDGFGVEKVKTANRKRIAIALSILQQLDEREQKTIFDYTAEYCPALKDDNNTFRISSEENLKDLLFGIEQRYYTTPVGNEKRCANSVIKLNQEAPKNEQT